MVEMSQRLSAVLNVEDLISSFLELVVTHADATKVRRPLRFLPCQYCRYGSKQGTAMLFTHIFSWHGTQGILFLTNQNNIMFSGSGDENKVAEEKEEGEYLVMRAKLVGDETTTQQSLPLPPPKVALLCELYKGESSSHFPSRIVNYVWRTNTSILLTDALHNEQFAGDPYLKELMEKQENGGGGGGPVSILCAAVTYKKKHCGVIFLENTVNFGAFNDERLKLVQILIAQFMISYENAQLVATLKQRNDELKKKNEELKELDKMKDSFLAVSNHELRTPLNGIMGMTSLLEETRLDEEQREYVKDIKSCSESLLKITSDMLYLCKLKAMKVTLEKRIFCVSECLETCMKVVELGGMQKGLAMNYVVEEGVPELVVGDYLRVKQVVLNLWSNAIKFTEKGEVVVSVSVWNRLGCEDIDEERAMKEAQGEDKSAKIFVQDNRGVLETSRWTERTSNSLKSREEIEEIMKGAEKIMLHFQVKDTGNHHLRETSLLVYLLVSVLSSDLFHLCVSF